MHKNKQTKNTSQNIFIHKNSFLSKYQETPILHLTNNKHRGLIINYSFLAFSELFFNMIISLDDTVYQSNSLIPFSLSNIIKYLCYFDFGQNQLQGLDEYDFYKDDFYKFKESDTI